MLRTHRVFVYGTLLRGHGNHRLLEEHGARFIGAGKTESPATMVSISGSFPAITDLGVGHCEVAGEVFEVDDVGLAALDRLEGYPRMYSRDHVTVKADDGRDLGSVYVYVWAEASAHYDVIESGSWAEHAS